MSEPLHEEPIRASEAEKKLEEVVRKKKRKESGSEDGSDCSFEESDSDSSRQKRSKRGRMYSDSSHSRRETADDSSSAYISRSSSHPEICFLQRLDILSISAFLAAEVFGLQISCFRLQIRSSWYDTVQLFLLLALNPISISPSWLAAEAPDLGCLRASIQNSVSWPLPSDLTVKVNAP